MVIISTLYCLLVYLVFFKLKLLPWNGITKPIAVTLGVVILTGFLVGLQGLTPASTQAFITGPVIEIAPQVSGRVIGVPVQPNVELDPGEVIFEIEPRPYQYRVTSSRRSSPIPKPASPSSRRSTTPRAPRPHPRGRSCSSHGCV